MGRLSATEQLHSLSTSSELHGRAKRLISPVPLASPQTEPTNRDGFTDTPARLLQNARELATCNY